MRRVLVLIEAIYIHLQLMTVSHDLLAPLLECNPHMTRGSSANIIPKNELLSILLNAC